MKFATGSVSAALDTRTLGRVPTLGDLRDWLREVETLGFPDDHVLDDCALAVWRDGLPVDTIECGDHIPHRDPRTGQYVSGPVDLLLSTHECK